MHGVSSGCSLLVNAEVDSMGGVIDSEDGIGTKTSPQQAAIEIAQAELRLEYDVREERRRELEFLEKGGNPLDFRFALAASLSIQSTSVADQIHDQFVTSETKGGFAVANSPRGDSVESNGILGATLPCEPNSADNFDGGNELVEDEGRAIYPGRTSIAPSEHSSQVDGSQNVRESEGSPSFQPNKAYKRRNRSKPNRDTARISSTDIASHRTPSSSLPSCPVVVPKAVVHEPLSDTEVDAANPVTMNPSNGCFSEGKVGMSTSRDLKDGLPNQDINDDGVLDAISSRQPDSFMEREEKTPAFGECVPCSGSEKPEDDTVMKQLSKPNRLHPDGRCLQSEDVVNNAAFISKGLDSDSSCTQTSISVEANGNMDSDLCNGLKNIASKGDGIKQKVCIDQTTMSKDETELDDRNVTCTTESKSCLNDSHKAFQANSYRGKDEEETTKRSSEGEAKSQHKFEDKQSNQLTNNVADRNQGLSTAIKSESVEKPQGPHDPYTNELNKASTSEPVAIETLPPAGNQTEVVDKAHEDRILEEAQIIEAKRERINDLSIGPLPKEYRRKSHWDFVLEEMAWMANDFAQERLWKRTTSSQLCQRAAFASRVKLEEKIKQRKVKTVAQTLARAVMEFWQSAGSCLVQSGIISGFEACGDGNTDSENKYHYRGLDEEPGGDNIKLALQQYVARFMKHNSSVVSNANIEAFGTSEREFCTDMPEMASLDQHIEEDLFYVVPHGAMEAYRKSIEIYTLQCEKAGKTMLEDLDTSMHDSFAEFASQENEYEEDEGESVYQFSGAFGGRKQPKFIQKRGRNTKSYIPKSYELDRDFPYDHCTENRISTPQSFVGKRPPNGLNVGSIPTKRVRTASRQRVLGPTMGGAGFIPVPRRTDASSGDTNSFQDDQTTVHGGSFVPRGLEVESRMDFDKQLTYDSSETTVKHKKKKKNKYQGETYDRRWQVDANMQGEQEHLKRRMDYNQYESSGNGGLLSHAKKLKIMKHSMDNSFENTNLMSVSVPSPVGSQMSNMSNQNKLIKLISGRDRGRKAKALKIPSGQAGSGSPWSLFEDQALVVLVHDMGPNWELVSDAINSTLYFKCIFRKPKECKERHKVLIEKSCADGADSADDSGCSQPYPSTLPGIPKGGARQLFQQLRGPIEENTIKSHFEKIILLGQLLHGRKKQEPKQLVPVHGSHASALLQVIPNNVNGGVLTPLDLCDMVASSPDVFSINYQSPHSGGGLPLANQGTAQPMHSSSGTNSLLQCPPGLGHASNLSSPSGQLSSPASVGRYGVQRTSLPVNEQHRVQQYNHMLSARNTHQTNTPVSGAFSGGDRNLRVPPGGNSMVMPGMSRSMSIPRLNLQGISSSPLLNSANSASPNVASIPMHSGASPGQGNITPQPRDALHMVRTGQNSEHPRQIMPPEMQLQATQASSQGVASFGGPSSTFLNHPASPSVPSYPVHKGTAEQQALAVRIARERQLQHRIMQRQQQQQQFPHHPLQNGLQNNSHMQSQASPIAPVSISSQQQLKHLNGVGGAMNQRQRPPGQQQQPQFQQSATARHHPPQKPKGFGKGNMSMHQPAVTQGSQMEKGERDIHPTPPPASSVPTPNQSMLPSRNHQQLRVHPVKSVNNSQPTVQRTVSQNCVSEADQLAKRQYDPSRADLPLANTTPNSSLE